jgi:hypothetical protein
MIGFENCLAYECGYLDCLQQSVHQLLHLQNEEGPAAIHTPAAAAARAVKCSRPSPSPIPGDDANQLSLSLFPPGSRTLSPSRTPPWAASPLHFATPPPARASMGWRPRRPRATRACTVRIFLDGRRRRVLQEDPASAAAEALLQRGSTSSSAPSCCASTVAPTGPPQLGAAAAPSIRSSTARRIPRFRAARALRLGAAVDPLSTPPPGAPSAAPPSPPPPAASRAATPSGECSANTAAPCAFSSPPRAGARSPRRWSSRSPCGHRREGLRNGEAVGTDDEAVGGAAGDEQSSSSPVLHGGGRQLRKHFAQGTRQRCWSAHPFERQIRSLSWLFADADWHYCWRQSYVSTHPTKW